MEEIKLFKNKSDCCGCGACLNICTKKAISMVEDKYGFLYPKINDKFCIRCGACKKVCAYQSIAEINEPIETYAAVTANTDILKSSSGGIFASIAKSVISDGGIVFGSSMENSNHMLTPMHIAVDNLGNLIKLQGSKYVHSYIGITYQKVKNELKTGRVAIFSGTPCQIAGLKSYLKHDYDNLLLIDIICHGVPSAKFFQDYIKQLEKKLNGKIVDFKFRDKGKGWGLNGKAIYKTSTGKIKVALISVAESSYYSLFLDSDIYRENCYQCKYACNNRPGDITIGDYWGIQKEHPELLASNGGVLNPTDGISCIIINTENGKRYVEQYKEGLQLNISCFEKVARGNEQLNAPCCSSTKRTEILELYKNMGYEAVEKWFVKDRGVKLYVEKFKNHIPKGMKKGMKKILGRA